MDRKRTLEGSFAAPGQSGVVTLAGYFNVYLGGMWSGTVDLKRRLAGQANYHLVSSFSANTLPPLQGHEADADGAEYLFDCTALTSGTIDYRLSQ